MNSSAGAPQVTAYSCRQCGSVALEEQSQQCCGDEMAPITADATNEPELMSLLSQVFGVSQTGIDVCVHVVAEEQVTTGGHTR